MAETAHKSVLKEIEKSRVISVLQENSKDDYDFHSSTKAAEQRPEQSRTTGIIRANTEIGDKRSRAHVQLAKKRPSIPPGCDGELDLDTRKLSSTLNFRDVTFSASENSKSWNAVQDQFEGRSLQISQEVSTSIGSTEDFNLQSTPWSTVNCFKE